MTQDRVTPLKGDVMLLDIQLKRGILDVCVMSALYKDESYGYKSSRIWRSMWRYRNRRFTRYCAGLRSMERDGLFKGTQRAAEKILCDNRHTGGLKFLSFLRNGKRFRTLYDFIKHEVGGEQL
jgi:hypothetical protein